MEKPRDAEPGPSREELRQISKSKTTGEFSGATPTPEQAASRATDDARVAELRESLGLEPELSDRRGIGNEKRVREGQPEYYNGFGQAVLAPRSEYASTEAERVSELKEWDKKISLAKSLGIELPDSTPLDKDDPDFYNKFRDTQLLAERAISKHYETFGKNLAKDPDMKQLITALFDARKAQREATSGSYGELLNVGLSPLRLKLSPKNIFYSAWLNFAGGKAVVDKGQEAMSKTEEVREKVVDLVCKKFQDAGLNSGLRTPVTPENTNQRRTGEIIGINLLSS